MWSVDNYSTLCLVNSLGLVVSWRSDWWILEFAICSCWTSGSPKGCVKKSSVVRALPVTIPVVVVFLEKNFYAFSGSVFTWGCADSSAVPFPPGTRGTNAVPDGLGPATDVLTKHPVQQVCAAAGTALWAGSPLVFLFFWLFWSFLTNPSVCCKLL